MPNKLDTLMAFTKIAKKMAVGVIGASKGIGRLLFESLEGEKYRSNRNI